MDQQLALETSGCQQLTCAGIFIVTFVHIWLINFMFLLLTLNI